MGGFAVGQDVRLSLAPEYTGKVLEVLDGDVYLVQLTGGSEVKYSGAVLEAK